MKKIIVILIAIICMAAFAGSSAAEVIAIINGTVVVGDGTVIENGTVIINGDRIEAVGAGLTIPEGATVIDASGHYVWPGIIDPYSLVGMSIVGMDEATNDSNEETSTNTADLRASDGINPQAPPIAVSRIDGITTALVSPGASNPINGQTAIVNLAGRTVSEMLIADQTALVFNFGTRRSGSYPSTRPGTVAMIRQALYDAQRYGEQKQKTGEKSEKGAENKNAGGAITDLKQEALLRALNGEIPVIAAGNEMQDIANALAVAEEFKLKLILLSPNDCWKMLDEIKASGFPVLVSNIFNMPDDRDHYDRYYKLAATLHSADIPFAFASSSSLNMRQMLDAVAMAVTFGLPEKEAIKAVTLYPAQILGIDDNYGTLAAGKIANVAIWNGNPLQTRSRVTNLFIKGMAIELVSMQELLRDKFEHPETVK